MILKYIQRHASRTLEACHKVNFTLYPGFDYRLLRERLQDWKTEGLGLLSSQLTDAMTRLKLISFIVRAGGVLRDAEAAGGAIGGLSGVWNSAADGFDGSSAAIEQVSPKSKR